MSVTIAARHPPLLTSSKTAIGSENPFSIRRSPSSRLIGKEAVGEERRNDIEIPCRQRVRELPEA
jgi:hypothetical protein